MRRRAEVLVVVQSPFVRLTLLDGAPGPAEIQRRGRWLNAGSWWTRFVTSPEVNFGRAVACCAARAFGWSTRAGRHSAMRQVAHSGELACTAASPNDKFSLLIKEQVLGTMGVLTLVCSATCTLQ